MAGVNGVEIKVGQVWRQRDGRLVRIVRREAYGPWRTVDVDDDVEMANTNDDGTSTLVDAKYGLVELVQDEKGFITWRGGEQPVPAGTEVEYVLRCYKEPRIALAGNLRWENSELAPDYDIVAYKVVESATAPPPADSAALAEEVLSALGWTFDGQTWVEQPTATRPVGMIDNPVSAPALLTAAAKHMNDRAATYDKPEGERSMAQTVAVFEAYHGIKLTEAQGWHFMQVLKDVRLFTRDTYHGDSAEDCIAYAALKAESLAYASLAAEAEAREGGAS